jgi:hypothetical protein
VPTFLVDTLLIKANDLLTQREKLCQDNPYPACEYRRLTKTLLASEKQSETLIESSSTNFPHIVEQHGPVSKHASPICEMAILSK